MWRPEEKKNQSHLKPPRRRVIVLKKILIALAVIIIAFLGVVAMQPSQFHNWEAWNPWAKLDPAMKQTYEGAPAGAGAIYTWAGNSEVGEGRMTLTESRPSDLIRIELEFLKPFPGTSTAEFTFKPEDNQTAVVWSMAGKNNFMAKAVCLFMSMDKMIGGQFEKGLAQMKAVAEATPKQ